MTIQADGVPFPAVGNHTFNVFIPTVDNNGVISSVGSCALYSVNSNGREVLINSFHRSQTVESGFHEAGLNLVFRGTDPSIEFESLP